MDQLERLIQAYQLRLSASSLSKLDVLMDIERIHDDHVVPFLLTILGDSEESEDVRIYVLKRLRNGNGLVTPGHRLAVANTIGKVSEERRATDLRLEAALALGEFIEIDGVLTLLINLCFAKDESIDLRYAAFTSLERAGPTPECVALLRQLSTDETLGRSARSVLSAWHIE
jgi:hypothetical protein